MRSLVCPIHRSLKPCEDSIIAAPGASTNARRDAFPYPIARSDLGVSLLGFLSSVPPVFSFRKHPVHRQLSFLLSNLHCRCVLCLSLKMVSLFLFCAWNCCPTRTHAHYKHAGQCPWRPEEDIAFPGIGVYNCCSQRDVGAGS